MVLVYPVVTLCGDGIAGVLHTTLLGTESQVGCEAVSPLHQVHPDMPPTLLVHARDDRIVPADHSERFHRALIRHGVPSELFLKDRGGHAFGLGGDPGNDWPAVFAEWLRSL